MQGILFDYKMNPTTWVYLSSLLTIGIFFKFRRFWSVRNLDLVALIGFSPGLLMLWYAKDPNYSGLRNQLDQLGYVWLFAASGFFLVRLLLDPVMVRRPLLEPNLSASGLTFTGEAHAGVPDDQRDYREGQRDRSGRRTAIASKSSRGGKLPPERPTFRGMGRATRCFTS